MAIKVVTIDFWNTLFDSRNGLERNQYRNKILKQNFEEMGHNFSDDIYDNAMQDSWKYFNTVWENEKRTPATGELIQFFWNKLGIKPDEERLDNIIYLFEESILKLSPELLPGVKENLPILKEKYDLAVVSDTGFSPGKVLKVLLHRKKIMDYFSAFSFSDETGVSKPHKKAFIPILDLFGCKPAEALHIGDIEKTDIAGAKALGMKAIRFAGDEQSYFHKKNPKKTNADAEAKHWDEIPELIGKIDSETNTLFDNQQGDNNAK